MKRLTITVLATALLLCISKKVKADSHQKAGLPDSVAAAVEVKALASLTKNVKKLGKSVSGRSLPANMVQRPLKQALGLKKQFSKLVDMNHPVRLVVFDPPRHATPVLLVRVTDVKAYFQTVSGDKDSKGSGGVRKLDIPMGAVAPLGNLLVMSRKKKATRQAVKALKGSTLTTKKALFPKGDLTVHVRPSDIMTALDEMPGSPLKMIKQVMRARLARKSKKQKMAGKMLLAEIEGFEAVARQMVSFRQSVMLSLEGVRLGCRVTAEKNSGLSDYFSSFPSDSSAPLRHIPADSILALGGNFGDLSPFVTWYSNMLKEMMSAGGVPESDVKKALSLLEKFLGVMGKEMGMGLLVNDAGSLTPLQYYKIKNPRKYRSLYPKLERMTEIMTAVPGGSPSLKIEPKAVNYGGKAIDRWTLKPNLSVPEAVPDDRKKKVKKMQNMFLQVLLGGTEPTIHSTFFNSTLVNALGGNSLDMLKTLIDGDIKSLSQSDAFRKRVSGLLKNYHGAGYLSLTGLLKGVLRVVHGTKVELPVPVKPGDLRFGSSPGIVMAYACSNRTGRMEIDIPAKELKTVQMGIQQAIMKTMMRMQRQKKQKGPGGPK